MYTICMACNRIGENAFRLLEKNPGTYSLPEEYWFETTCPYCLCSHRDSAQKMFLDIAVNRKEAPIDRII